MTTHFFGDTAVLTGRTMRHVTRSLDTNGLFRGGGVHAAMPARPAWPL